MNPLNVVRESWFFLRQHRVPIAMLCLPLIVLEAVARQLLLSQYPEVNSVLRSVLPTLVLYPLYTVLLLQYVDAHSGIEEFHPTPRQLWYTALQLWSRMALLYAVENLLAQLGMMLLILPGIYVMVRLAFAEYFLVLYRFKPLQAMQASVALTAGRFWPTLGCLLIPSVPALLVASFGNDPQTAPWLAIACDFLGGAIGLFASLVIYRLGMLAEDARARS